MRLTPKAAILSVVLMVLLLYMMVPLRSYLEQRARLTDLQQQSTSLQQQQARLLNQIAELQDPDYLQRIAREYFTSEGLALAANRSGGIVDRNSALEQGGEISSALGKRRHGG